MLGRLYEGQDCSAARALEVVGERWTLLIVRDALFRGISRFSDFQRSLGVARNVLAARLDLLIEEGLMERRPSADSAYDSYVLTKKGQELRAVIIALTHWGDRWAAPDGRPVVFRHLECGGEARLTPTCAACESDIRIDEIEAVPNSRRRAAARMSR
jgi:DNA-binding HxlR family transcriptional regulator